MTGPYGADVWAPTERNIIDDTPPETGELSGVS